MFDYKIFDSHAHYNSEQYDEDRNEVIERIKENRVIGVMNCGTDVASSKDTVALCEKYDIFYGAVGVHPSDAFNVDDKMMSEIEELASHPKIKAIGEVGLDYYWEENPSREEQKATFRKHLELAKKLNMPIIIHDRDAHQDTLEIMKEYPDVIGVVHCFSGSAEMAAECLKLGYYIGITGVVTFKNAKKIIDVVEVVPMDRLLVETDAPFMSPVPKRGKRNESSYVEYVIEKIAEIKGITSVEVSEKTIENTKKLFNIV
ncbi:TatD family hydrolase [uncultured Clostridium sp.]|jgi:TatD DNase family protein|uniref:TatD family hydrolase n=1 Tax=uncultured Clostridium sp. TaxID=59620 RepID=UPI00263244F9|nr:TatD family hydrolase [uncultured Clostridium sp.]